MEQAHSVIITNFDKSINQAIHTYYDTIKRF